jgi:hypothetical protein
MNEPQPSLLRVYSRPGCHLCEQLIEDLMPLIRGRMQLEVVDIDSRADWKQAYWDRIPVVEYRGQVVCQYILDPTAIREVLRSAPAS